MIHSTCRPISFILPLVIFFIVALVFVSPIPADDTLYVDGGASGANDGSSWVNAYNELRDALAGAADLPGVEKMEVWVAAGTYAPAPPGGDRVEAFSFFKGYEFYGGFAGGETERSERVPLVNVTILSGDLNGDDGPGFANNTENSRHVMWTNGASGGMRILDGFTVTGGNADGASYGGRGGGLLIFSQTTRVTGCRFESNYAVLDGGGVYNEASSWFTSCTIIGNRADDRGGGLFNNWSRPRLIDCTIDGNTAAGFGGGGVYNEHGGPTFTGCLLQDNTAEGSFGNGYGGAMTNTASDATVSDCRFLRNSALAVGGALFNQTGSDVLFTDCSFEEGTGSSGAVTNLGSDPTFIGCLFSDNTGVGSGAFNNTGSGNPLLIHCTFLGNLAGGFAGDGGGFRNSQGSPVLVGCLFSGNEAARNGGALADYGLGTLSLINCTMGANSAALKGGGIYALNTSSDILLDNCIVWGNTHAFGTGQKAQLNAPGSGIFSVNYSCVKGWNGNLGGTGNFGDAPLFIDLTGPDGISGTSDDDLGLSPGSPCIDAGDNDALPADSQDLDGDGNTAEPLPIELAGFPRFFNDTQTLDTGNGNAPVTDVGSFEFQGIATSVESPGEAVPGEPALLTNFPNPFNPVTEIRFTLPRAGVVTLSVHDARGALVATPVRGGHRDAGSFVTVWDGKGEAGNSAPSGIYFLRLRGEGLSATRKIALIR